MLEGKVILKNAIVLSTIFPITRNGAHRLLSAKTSKSILWPFFGLPYLHLASFIPISDEMMKCIKYYDYIMQCAYLRVL